MRLTVQALDKSYSTQVLRNVNLQVGPGEIHAIVGENGAGKTTLLNILSGNTRPDRGTMTLDGSPYTPANAQQAYRAGLSLCSQELGLIDNLSVAENIGLRALPGWLLLDRASLRRRCHELLADLALDLQPDETVRHLSLPNRQLVEMAKALNGEARVLLLDEPTSALNAQQAAAVHACLRKRAQQGTSIIYVSHRLDDVLSFCDHVWVLRDGQIVHDGPTESLTPAALIQHMSGAEMITHLQDTAAPPGPIHLSVKQLQSAAIHHPISLDCHRGEILGLAGLMGAGRTELLNAIYGIEPRTAGSVTLTTAGGKVALTGSAQAIANGVGMVPEDRASQGIFRGLSVAFNTTIAELSRIASHHILNRGEERRATEALIRRLNVKCESSAQNIEALSGGNQQKLMLARWLHHECSLLLLDEPTRGVDVSAKLAIHTLLRSLRDQGTAIVVASSELEELLVLCDRIAVMSAGKLVTTFERAAFDQDKILAASFSGHGTARVA